MSNDERVKKLEKLLDVALERADTLEKKQTASKPNKAKLKKLANDIRKNLEEYSVEASVHSDLTYRPQH
ncbi:MAG TPA: hypothetical protein VFT49_03815 [Candidatus Saccharimonadales bacterium]|nr:hypothetical protein [Candidatus Saccharimonadales bacterium]